MQAGFSWAACIWVVMHNLAYKLLGSCRNDLMSALVFVYS